MSGGDSTSTAAAIVGSVAIPRAIGTMLDPVSARDLAAQAEQFPTWSGVFTSCVIIVWVWVLASVTMWRGPKKP